MRDYDGVYTTPKRMAQDILMNAVTGRMEFFLESQDIDHLTANQQIQVYRQGQKLAKRIAKMLQYDPESFFWSAELEGER